VAASRPVDAVTLIAVTKTHPASDVVHLAALGVRSVGENRDQEAAGKAAEVAAAGAEVAWHYIGQLQRNKCRSVASYASAVHSVDRLPLVTALADARDADARDADARDEVGARLAVPLDVFVQVNLDPAAGAHRGGAVPADVLALADAVAARDSLRLAGVMAVAPLGAAGPDLDRAFATLAATSESLRRAYPEANGVSAGMSSDLEIAISHGATHVRVGSLLLGMRTTLG
jgi:PLP dependent protein